MASRVAASLGDRSTPVSLTAGRSIRIRWGGAVRVPVSKTATPGASSPETPARTSPYRDALLLGGAPSPGAPGRSARAEIAALERSLTPLRGQSPSTAAEGGQPHVHSPPSLPSPQERRSTPELDLLELELASGGQRNRPDQPTSPNTGGDLSLAIPVRHPLGPPGLHTPPVRWVRNGAISACINTSAEIDRLNGYGIRKNNVN